VLQVRDDGRGIPAARGQAAGVGLRIMESRSEAMGGRIEFGSVKPCGTRVRCTVPLPTLARRSPR
jgi:signal transduction histidine kinase